MGGRCGASARLRSRDASASLSRQGVAHYCQSFRRVPRRIVLDIDDSFDAVHGGQQLRLFNAHDDEYGFQPIVVFDGDGRMIAAVLRPACRPSGRQIVKWLRRLLAALRAHWPRAELERSTAARRLAAGGEQLRRFKEFYDGAASWDRVERIIARVEAGPDGVHTRVVATSLAGGTARALYQDVYCARGQADNHIEAWKTHLAADRTSCCRASANQLRLFLHLGASWLMWSLRSLMPRRSWWRVAQFDTLRLRLIKIAARVEVLTRHWRVHRPKATPNQAIFALALSRLPRLVI